MGYHATHTPAVIQRNVLENPGWYTAYTPYQAEISQGRLEGLLNFQQMVIDLTGLPVANASLLDEATAAAEAMAMIRRSAKSKAAAFFVDSAVHPQVLSVMRTRAKWLGIELIVGDDVQPEKVFGAHLQYPDTFGRIRDFSEVIHQIHAAQGLVSMGTDLLALLLLRSPGAMGADVAIGSAQRFGVPMGFGGPHAAFMACRDEYRRCRRASSTSGATRRRATSAPRRPCSPTWPASMPCTTARVGSRASRCAPITWRACSPPTSLAKARASSIRWW
jgi:glycine dehydrogenase